MFYVLQLTNRRSQLKALSLLYFDQRKHNFCFAQDLGLGKLARPGTGLGMAIVALIASNFPRPLYSVKSEA